MKAAFAPALVLACALLVGACGITAPRGSEGFADLDSLGLADTDRVLALSIGPAVLNFAAKHAEDDPETQALLRGLDGVRIRVYEINGNASRVSTRMQSMSQKLVAGGWEQVMLVRSAGDVSILPVDRDGVPIFQARVSLKWDASSILSALLWAQYMRDNNGTFVERDPNEGTAALRSFTSPDFFGLGTSVQARF